MPDEQRDRMSAVRRAVPRLPVAALEPVVAFYRDVLGFDAGDPWPADAPTFAILERDGVMIQFFVPASPAGLPESSAAPDDRPMLTLEVSDARALHAHLLAHGTWSEWGEPQVYWYGRREFAVRDPAGYLLILSEETDDPPTVVEAG